MSLQACEIKGEMFEIGCGEEGWPQSFECLPNGMDRIYGIGSRSVLLEPCLAVIGARRATPYGLATAEMAGRIAAECGVVVVSGGAMGCDAAACRAAMSAGGNVIVISGCGADVIYPRSSEDVFLEASSRGGAVISFEKWGTPPRRYAFPKRNRAIAALCTSLIVTEAGVPSGTFGTAQEADALGRNVYSVPGSIFSPESRGTNQLIEQGAAVIVDELSLESRISLDFSRQRIIVPTETPDRGRVLSALVASPMRADEISTRLGSDVLTVVRSLSDYEARGLVERLPDGRYVASREALLMENGKDC